MTLTWSDTIFHSNIPKEGKVGTTRRVVPTFQTSEVVIRLKEKWSDSTSDAENR